MERLYKDNPSHRHMLLQWERAALEKFETKMEDQEKPFPCIPASIGFKLNQIRYGFAGDPRQASSVEDVFMIMKEYNRQSKHFGPYTSLVIFYNTTELQNESFTVEQYEQLFWEQMNGLTERDHAKWPEHIPTDPHNPLWEFCFNGEQYFMYCASPSHKNRNSRHFDYFMLAITPRWVLQEFNKSEKNARKIKAQVRKRLGQYDSIEIHPDLNTYGNGDNFEWRQYFLRDNHTSLSKCPFHKFEENKE